ncbi:MAG: hypothetical protein ACD_49C00029G0028 [uncultured bacterium (gcode 4)]|uniref:Baseplate protein J-like domain-containing protein n=1 Tax=uncultured bacterium (gcode 4) TaxID=1234023 RepID=K2AF21_9BACT|nr:MAG: hypothetical protein ACD_49C00029G0028 [uncultured bacterium (gcode 4)]
MNNKEKKIVIKNTDTILDIVSKIEKEAKDSNLIYLEVEDNFVLKNYFNLKLLTYRFSSKKLHIITSDRELKALWEKLWIKFFYKSDDIEFEENFAKTHILRYNFTFLEYLLYEVKKISQKSFFFFKKRVKTYKNKKMIEDSNFFLLIFGLVISLSLLSFIFYFAVSKTYIYINPELGVKTVSRNIIYSMQNDSSLLDGKNVIQTRNITAEDSLDYTFNVSTIDKKSTKNAYGSVEIYNELRQEQIFKPNTRFVTDSGLVFRSSEWAKVPPATSASWAVEAWKIVINITADPYDLAWNLAWKRWNIASDVVLTIPGLKFNRDKIYAKTTVAFTGWVDPKIHILTTEELEKFKNILGEKLKTKSLETLKQKVKTANIQNNEDYQILPINNIIKYELSEIKPTTEVKVWDKIEEITLKWSVVAKSFIYDKRWLVSYLKNILNENILLWTEKLININEDSVKITNILSQSETSWFQMKATTELDSTISYNFEDSTNNLTKKLKNLIAWSTQKEATSILLNDPNIANVKIEFSPFWLTRVSSNPDSIDFIIEK